MFRGVNSSGVLFRHLYDDYIDKNYKSQRRQMSGEVKKVNLKSKNITEETLEELKRLVPSAFKEGKYNPPRKTNNFL